MGVYDFSRNSRKICDCESGDFPYQSSANAYKIIGSELFIPQTNGEVSDSLVQNWTRQAFECYTLKGNCRECSISHANYSFVCQMHKIVPELVKTKGVPDASDFSFD